jgi:hypothetical protein
MHIHNIWYMHILCIYLVESKSAAVYNMHILCIYSVESKSAAKKKAKAKKVKKDKK